MKPSPRNPRRLTLTERGSRWLARVAFALLLLALGAFVATGANGPPDPTLAPATLAPAPSVERFSTVSFRARAPGHPPSAFLCALLAETEAQHAQGLMGRRDLGGYDAMVFRFASETTSSFYMRNVPVPLSAAWFDASGRFVDSADMAPCADREGCPLYRARRPYRFALEVPKGGLARVGVTGPGSTLEVDGACG